MSALKPATSIDRQIEILRERGMSVDESLARQWLSSVSYYRLSGYWYAYRILPADADPKNPHRLDKFERGTSFSDVARLYEFDRKLRPLIHDGIERIEVALRAKISDYIASEGSCLTLILQFSALSEGQSGRLFRRNHGYVFPVAPDFSRNQLAE